MTFCRLSAFSSYASCALAWRVFFLLSLPALSAWATWDPSVLHVPWASDFNAIAANEINVRTDSRLTVKAMGDGQTDDTAAIRQAIAISSTTGGGTVYFPAGDYELFLPSDVTQAHPLVVPSRVILRGDSAQTSRLFLNNNNASVEGDGVWQWAGITFLGSSYVGMTDLGVVNVNPTTTSAAVLWNRPLPSSPATQEIFFNDMDIRLGYGKSIWVQNTTNFLFQNSFVDSTALDTGPIFFDTDVNFSVLQSTITYHYSRVHIIFGQNGVIANNAMIRDAQGNDMDNGTAIESGGLEVTYGSNLQITNNLFQQNNTPPTEFGDGEAVMAQHSTIMDVEDLGSVTGVSLTTLTDNAARWGTLFQQMIPQTPQTIVAFISGRASGTWRTVTAVDPAHETITVDQPFYPVPDIGDLYVITRWTLRDTLIQNNLFVGNPHGAPIWDGGYNVTLDHNTFYDSNNLMIRANDWVGASSYAGYTDVLRRAHLVAFHNKITNNTLITTQNIRPSQLLLDAEGFFASAFVGLGFFDIQIAGNHVNPNPSNPSAGEYWGQDPTQDGFYPCYNFGPGVNAQTPSIAFKNVYYWNNVLDTPVAYTTTNAGYASLACLNQTSVMMGTPSLTVPSALVARDATLQVAYSGGAAVDHFEWQLFPSTGSVPSSIIPVEFITQGPAANLAAYNFSTSAYQVSVEAIDAAGNRSAPAHASITLAASATSPTSVATLGSQSVRVFPNPWRQDKNASRFVTFSGLSAGTPLKIFTVSGHDVASLTATTSGSASWDLNATSGDPAASGLYLFLGKDSAGQNAKGTFAIIR